MADAGQRVIFRQDRDIGSAVLAELGGIAGLEPERLALDRDAVALDRVGQPLGRLEFLQRQFRLAMDRMAQRQEFLGQPVDRRADIFLQLFQ